MIQPIRNENMAEPSRFAIYPRIAVAYERMRMIRIAYKCERFSRKWLHSLHSGSGECEAYGGDQDCAGQVLEHHRRRGQLSLPAAVAHVKYSGKQERKNAEERFSVALHTCADIRRYALFSLVDLLTSASRI